MIIAWHLTLNVDTCMAFNLDVVHCMVINQVKIDDTLPYIKQDCTNVTVKYW